jgi:predicted metal-binding membrane protein
MNVLWIAALAALVLLEKALPFGKFVSRIFGCVFIAGGAWFLLQM